MLEKPSVEQPEPCADSLDPRLLPCVSEARLGVQEVLQLGQQCMHTEAGDPSYPWYLFSQQRRQARISICKLRAVLNGVSQQDYSFLLLPLGPAGRRKKARKEYSSKYMFRLSH